MIKDKTIFIKNIYYMLSYAFRSLNEPVFKNIATEEFDNIHNLLAAILVTGLSQQLKHGLYREYLNRVENLSVVRGRIDMPGTIKNRIEHKRYLTCQFDELSENNLLNQILKTTALLLVRHGNVKADYRDSLRQQMMFFSDIDEIDPLSVQWSMIRFQRNNRTYRMLISICQLIITGMLLTTDSGEYKLQSFINDHEMSKLYERFIFEYYRQEFSLIRTTASQIPWAIDDSNKAMLPIMQSDVMLAYRDKILIVDAKYYKSTTQVNRGEHKNISQNLYQIFAYVKNKAAELVNRPYTVSGMLLYARTDETIQPDQTYQMSGNKISVKTLDLNLEFAKIAAQLDKIAEEHFGAEIYADRVFLKA